MATEIRPDHTSLPGQKGWRAALIRLEGAYSESTLRGYRADLEIFEAWTIRTGLTPLPATPETVAAFVASQAQTCAAATIKRRLAAIRKVHRVLRLENPIADEEVVIALRRALRAKRVRPRQALGLTKDMRELLLTACPQTPAGLRDRAMIALGYDTLCRRSELVGLRVEDVTPSQDGAAQILVRRSKNDPFGAGRLAYVSPRTLRIVRAWLAAGKITAGPIVRAVRSDGAIGRVALHPYSVTRILKRVAVAARLPAASVAQLSGHSMRVGAAQDMIASGLGVLPIMQAGGWRTMNVVARYVESANLSVLLRHARGDD
jgi:site-specific recombinase XerD